MGDRRRRARRVGERIKSLASYVITTELIPDSIRGRYARKFFAAVLVIVLVTTLVGAAGYVQVRERLDEQVETQVTATAELQADGFEEWIESRRMQTRALSTAAEFRRGDVKEIGLFLLQKRDDLPADVVGVHYASAYTGEILASTHPELRGVNATERGLPWATDRQKLRSQFTVVSRVETLGSPYDSPVSNDTVVALASSPPGNTEHIVIVTLSLTERAASTFQTMDGAHTTLRDADGEPIVSSAGSIGESGSTLSVPANATGFLRRGREVVGHAPVAGTSWIVATHVPRSSAFALRNQVGGSLLRTVLTAVLAIGLVTAVVGRRSTRALRDLADRAAEMEAGNLDVELETDRIDEFGRLYEAFDGMRRSLRETIDETEAFNAHLEATADEYRAVMADCADGDLTRRMEPSDRSEAMADVAVAYNEMLDRWEVVIDDADDFGAAVAAGSDEAAAGVERARETSVSVGEATDDIAARAETQAADLDAAAAELQEFAATIEEVTVAAEEVARTAERAADRGERGREAAEEGLDELEEIESATAETAAAVEELTDVVEEVESVVSFIDGVAEQTHVLALNASIEAGRAGASGSGFAVVAEEVKELAAETRTATEEVEDGIGRVRDRAEAAVEDMRETRRKVETGSETVADALAALEEVVDDVAETDASVREITDATAAGSEAVDSVVATVDDVAASAETTRDAASRAADAADSGTQALEAVSGDVDDLASRADRLRRLLDGFETGDRPTESDGTSGPLSERDASAADALSDGGRYRR